MQRALELQIRSLDPCHAAVGKEPAAGPQAPRRILCVAPNHWGCTGLQRGFNFCVWQGGDGTRRDALPGMGCSQTHGWQRDLQVLGQSHQQVPRGCLTKSPVKSQGTGRLGTARLGTVAVSRPHAARYSASDSASRGIKSLPLLEIARALLRS